MPSRAYRKANRDKVRASDKHYYETHKEQVRAYNKRYSKAHREANPEYYKLRARAYSKANPEKVAKAKKAWAQANPEKGRKYCKTYSEANKDKISIKNRKWREKTVGYRKAYRIDWCKAHPEYMKKYQKAHLEKFREHYRKYRALRYATQIEPIDEKQVYLRDGWKCQHCKKKVNKRLKWPDRKSATLDHIVPLSKGGAHIYSNVQLTHWACNHSKQARTLPQGEQLRCF